jgi:cation transport regulator ChaB
MKEAYVGGLNFEKKVTIDENTQKILKHLREAFEKIMKGNAKEWVNHIESLIINGMSLAEIREKLPQKVQNIFDRIIKRSIPEDELEKSEIGKQNVKLTTEHEKTLYEIEQKLPKNVKDKIDNSSSSILKKALKIAGYAGAALIIAYLGYAYIPGAEGLFASLHAYLADSTFVKFLSDLGIGGGVEAAKAVASTGTASLTGAL